MNETTTKSQPAAHTHSAGGCCGGHVHAEPPLVSLSERAQVEVKKILAEDPAKKSQGVRLAVVGGGCSGFSYRFMFDQERPGDKVVPFDGFNAYVDLKSAIYLKGVAVDYQGGLSGKGFVFHNPNAKSSCGCGESFSI